MTPLRVVMVDDEPIACRALGRMLAKFTDVQVCGQAHSVDEARALVTDVRADVVYLDIELFGESGFDLVPRLDADVAVVFVTAFNQYAIRAFEVNALDYLLKPVTEKRLAESIRRLREHQTSRPPSPGPQGLKMDDLLLVQAGKKRIWLPLGKVCVIEAVGDFTVLRSSEGLSGTVWRSMRHWERLLPREQFVRIHRTWIVNLDHVEAYKTAPGNRLELQMAGLPKPICASRRLTSGLRKRLSNRPS